VIEKPLRRASCLASRRVSPSLNLRFATSLKFVGCATSMEYIMRSATICTCT